MNQLLILPALLMLLLTACGFTPPSDPEATAPPAFAATQAVQPAATDTPPPSVTPKPTDTPAATDTPRPEAPTPTPAPPDLSVKILSSFDYVDSAGALHIVGEVQNFSDQPVELVQAVATFYDVENRVVTSSSSYTTLDVIPPGGKSPFDVTTDEFAGAAFYLIQIQGRPGAMPRQDLEISSHRSFVDDGDLVHVAGEVTNMGDTAAESVKVVVTFYDEEGRVVNTTFTYTDLDQVPAGGSSPFDAVLEIQGEFDQYEVYVQGE